MFIGHYGPTLAAKPLEKRLPLWLLFLAVQWLDVAWSALVMLGVERLRALAALAGLVDWARGTSSPGTSPNSLTNSD